MPELIDRPEPSEERTAPPEISLLTVPIDFSLLERVSSFSRLRRVTAWAWRFIYNCRAKKKNETPARGTLTTKELRTAEERWIAATQHTAFSEEISILQKGEELRSGRISTLRPFVDPHQLLHVGGRQNLSSVSYDRRHPVILPGNSTLTKLIIRGEHLRLLHAGPTLVAASLARRFHILGGRRAVRTVTPVSYTHLTLPTKRIV